MTIREASQQLIVQLYDLYDVRESRNIADLVMERLTGWDKINRVLNKQVLLSEPMKEKWDEFSSALMKGIPVQYVLEEAWFKGLKFIVSDAVLIPRPETEELVEWVLQEGKRNKQSTSYILDIGTGSGCIAISIKKECPTAFVTACDISEEALNIAKKNAEMHDTSILFMNADILDEKDQSQFNNIDIIVSNPPYIPASEKHLIPIHVKAFEPSIALFVDHDPLQFYKAIADFGMKKLNKRGRVYVEVHEEYGKEVLELFVAKGYQECVIRKDMQGKERIVGAVISEV